MQKVDIQGITQRVVSKDGILYRNMSNMYIHWDQDILMHPLLNPKNESDQMTSSYWLLQ